MDTGRSGKYWRVLFYDDGRFELLSRDRPIEGTHIRIVKQVDASEVDGWRERARQVLGYWCRHASIPVRFEDEDVRTPFEGEL
ncbi:MAG: hypothetical protein ABEN55_14350 [Bradymonadaceae bacterium]